MMVKDKKDAKNEALAQVRKACTRVNSIHIELLKEEEAKKKMQEKLSKAT